MVFWLKTPLALWIMYGGLSRSRFGRPNIVPVAALLIILLLPGWKSAGQPGSAIGEPRTGGGAGGKPLVFAYPAASVQGNLQKLEASFMSIQRASISIPSVALKKVSNSLFQ